MDNKIDPCDTMRTNLIAAAAGLQQCTKTAANIIPIPGGDRVIAIGTPVRVRALLAAAPAVGCGGTGKSSDTMPCLGCDACPDRAPTGAQPDRGAAKAPTAQAVPMEAIGKILAEAMARASANGANSVSMPDEYVAIAHFVAYPEKYATAPANQPEASPASQPVAPTDAVLVPRTITEDMHVAAVRVINRATGNADWPPMVWDAMLAAAPVAAVAPSAATGKADAANAGDRDQLEKWIREAIRLFGSAMNGMYWKELGEHLKSMQEEGYRLLGQSTATSAADAKDAALTQAARDVLAERRRQVEQEGWTPKHDDKYSNCELARAAATYALCSHIEQLKLCGEQVWPWHPDWWKRTTYRRDLIKAGALILAEIERIDRAAMAAAPSSEKGGAV